MNAAAPLKRSVAAGLLAAVTGVQPWAQAQNPEPPVAFRSGLDIVRVEASVLDDDRMPVRGLTADDFVVLEDGRERPIEVFTAVDLPRASPPAATEAAWVRGAPRDVFTNDMAETGRLVVIVFDWSIRFHDQALARRIALAAVDGLGPTDEAAVLFTKPVFTAGTPQGFTADRARLRAAINRPFAPARADPDPKNGQQLIDPDGYETGECLCGVCTLEALTRLGDRLRPVSSRPKVVLFIGTYVRTFEAMRPTLVPPLIPGRITPSFSSMPGTTDCPVRLRDARRAFERSMGAANVTVHVLDPVGLETPANSPLGPRRTRERLDSLPVMADMTGGRAVTNAAAPDEQVAAILHESGSYYVLGFTPDASTRPDKARRLEVRMRQHDLTVKVRSEYTLAEQPGSANRPETPLARVLTDVLPVGDVPLTMSAVPMIAGRRSAAVLVGRIGPGAPRPIAMLTAAFTAHAAPVASRRVAIEPSTDTEADSRALGLVSALALEPGAYEVRVATQLPDGTAGSVHTFVDVPDFMDDPLAMSGVLLHIVPEEPAAPHEEIDGALPFVPTARRTFASTDRVSAFVQVSQGTARDEPLEPVSLHLRVQDARDTTLRDQTSILAPAEFASNRTANARFTLPVQHLQPGEYLLRLEATLGERRIDRLVRFTMR